MVRVPDAKSDCSCRVEAKVRILNFKTTWSEFHHLPKAVVCVSTPRIYPRSGYFLVTKKTTLHSKLLKMVIEMVNSTIVVILTLLLIMHLGHTVIFPHVALISLQLR